MRKVVYPYSNLKHSHDRYVGLLYDFFDSMYDRLYLNIQPTPENLVVHMFLMDPAPIYNPMNFEPGYCTHHKYTGKRIYISHDSLFNDVYGFITDLCPYLIFKLYERPDYYDKPFKTFSLKETFFNHEVRKEYGNSNNFSKVLYL